MVSKKSDLAALRGAVDANVPDVAPVLPEYLTEDQAREIKDTFVRRDELVAEVEAVVKTAETETREFTVAEAEARGRNLAEIDRCDDHVRKIEKDARQAHATAVAAEARVTLGIGDQPVGTVGGNVKVNLEHRTYEKGNGVSYLYDLCAISFGPGTMQGRYFQALERMQRHALENHVEATELDSKSSSSRNKNEEYFLRQMIEAKNYRESPVVSRSAGAQGVTSYRALSTVSGAGGEFVPPLYLTADWLAFARAGRVVADAMHKEPLPDGTMSINIPKVTAGTSVATQGQQNVNVSDTDITTAYVTVPVYTKAGMQIVSLQLLERSPIEFDQVVFGDLMLALAQSVDTAVINGSGVNDVTGILNTASINTVTWTQAVPTIKGFYGQVEQAKVDIAQARFLPATHAFMTPARWGYIEQSFDSNNRPLVVPESNGAWNVLQVAPPQAEAQGLTGARFLGLDLFQDANIPSNLGVGTNQDVVIVTEANDNWLMESPVVTRALPQTFGAQMSVLLQLYEYLAFTCARFPTANAIVTGTGLVSPVYNS